MVTMLLQLLCGKAQGEGTIGMNITMTRDA